jgi:hypothetical protein
VQKPTPACTVLLSMVVALTLALTCPAAAPPARGTPAQDACQTLLHQSTPQLHQILAARLALGFPVRAQLEEGNARLAAPALLGIDCGRRYVVVSGLYEFRGNLGVMDITRHGSAVLRLHLTPGAEGRQVWLETPEVVEVTFDNPAPWFDGKAIRKWVLSLFSSPLCAHLQNGQPC